MESLGLGRNLDSRSAVWPGGSFPFMSLSFITSEGTQGLSQITPKGVLLLLLRTALTVSCGWGLQANGVLACPGPGR